jgi:hypothetical protein
MAGWQVLSRPSAAEGGGRRPAFTGLATQPYSATEVDGWQHRRSRVSQNRAAVHAAPSVHNLVRSKSGRDRSGCRREPELGSARTETAGQSPPSLATAHMDAFGNDWNTAPACVLSTVWGTASIRDLAVEVGAVPASPIRQVLNLAPIRLRRAAIPHARKPVDLWTTQECCPQTHRHNSSHRQSE